jgi:uncharacterized protein
MTHPGSVARDASMDVARAIAILGMFVIHAVLVLATQLPTQGVSGFVLWWCDGRAAATFVTLAGFGVAKLAARYEHAEGMRVLHRRALVLWVMGVANLVIWPGDILRVYGVALLLAPWLLRLSERARVVISIALGVAFPLLMTVIDWTQHWQLETLTYVGVWTPAGFVRNLLYDGFRPVVPWLAFFIMGTVLAGQDLHDTRLWRRLLVAGAVLTLASVLTSNALNQLLLHRAPELDALTREGLVGTTSLPPLPLFMLSAVGTTSLLLGSVLALVPHLPRAFVEPLVATGRRALTWYLLHIALLMTLYAAGFRQRWSPGVAIAIGVSMFVWAVAWSQWRRARPGLFERFMRWAAGSHTSGFAPAREQPLDQRR